MANIPIWPGSGSAISGSTPFGYYDTESAFQSDGPNIANWCARRLGYPIVDIEMQDINFYACFEEAVSEYSAIVNTSNIKDNMLNLQGAPTGSSVTGVNVRDNMGRIVKLAGSYGTEVGVGGDVDWKMGYIETSASLQEYDLDTLWAAVSESGNSIEVKRVFYESSPAVTRYFDPYVGSGLGTTQLLDAFGFGNMSVGVNFLMSPVFSDMLRLQAIEWSDLLRKSAYSFELINNKMRVFPVPTGASTLYFQYIVTDDRSNPIPSGSAGAGVASDISNAPYSRMTYNLINDPGRQWIKKYTLALAKELLGAIRSKYSNVPIPGSEVTLDGSELRQQAATEKEQLIEELTTTLESMGRKAQLEQKKDEAEFMQEILNKATPYPIYIK
jgi:hypothetical protein